MIAQLFGLKFFQGMGIPRPLSRLVAVMILAQFVSPSGHAKGEPVYGKRPLAAGSYWAGGDNSLGFSFKGGLEIIRSSEELAIATQGAYGLYLYPEPTSRPSSMTAKQCKYDLELKMGTGNIDWRKQMVVVYSNSQPASRSIEILSYSIADGKMAIDIQYGPENGRRDKPYAIAVVDRFDCPIKIGYFVDLFARKGMFSFGPNNKTIQCRRAIEPIASASLWTDSPVPFNGKPELIVLRELEDLLKLTRKKAGPKPVTAELRKQRMKEVLAEEKAAQEKLEVALNVGKIDWSTQMVLAYSQGKAASPDIENHEIDLTNFRIQEGPRYLMTMELKMGPAKRAVSSPVVLVLVENSTDLVQILGDAQSK
ncbi:MAG: hypothetical protein NTV55_14605 [Planctomycetota bacterium]|nr:hypothetical protein [Planctomycetota bacterium]